MGRRTRRVVYFIAAAVFVVLGIGVFLVVREPSLEPHEKQVHAVLKRAIESKSTTIPLTGVIDADWVSVCIVPSYISEQRLNRLLGHEVKNYGELKQWINDEGYWSLVFITSAHELIPVRVPKMAIGTYDLAGAEWISCASRDRAGLQSRELGGPGEAPRKFRLVTA